MDIIWQYRAKIIIYCIYEIWKHAYNEGLAENKKSFDDSQSIAINQYDLSGKLLNEYGSIREASRKCNIPLSTIFNQCKNETYPRKYNFYFRYNNK